MTVHTNNHIFGANNDQFCFLNIANMSNVYIYIFVYAFILCVLTGLCLTQWTCWLNMSLQFQFIQLN